MIGVVVCVVCLFVVVVVVCAFVVCNVFCAWFRCFVWCLVVVVVDVFGCVVVFFSCLFID